MLIYQILGFQAIKHQKYTLVVRINFWHLTKIFFPFYVELIGTFTYH